MTELRRLLDGEGDELERALLGSALGDAPSKHAREDTLVALGIGGGIVATGTAVATAGAAAEATKGAVATAAKVGTAAAIKSTGLTVFAKWVGIAAVGGLGTWGAVEHVRAPDPPPAAATTQVPAAAPATAQAGPPTDDVPPKPAALSEAGEPAAAAEPETVAATEPALRAATDGVVPPQTSSEPVPAQSKLAGEVSALDRARSAMQSGAHADALSEIAAYERKYPGGTLGPEAEVLRIEALVQRGEHDRARALGAQFVADHPTSPHAQRVRSIVTQPAGSE